MYYVEDTYTDEIVDTCTSVYGAMVICRGIPGTIVTDDDDNVYYCNDDKQN